MDITTTPVYRGLLSDILEHPQDDTPRLVMSDWLDENDDPDWAEFIRAQVKAAATGYVECPQKEEWQKGRDIHCGRCTFCVPMLRAEELHEADGGSRFIGKMPFSYAHTCNHWSLHANVLREHPTLYLWRGFVACVRCPIIAWRAHGRVIVSRHPVEHVELTDVPYTEHPFEDQAPLLILHQRNWHTTEWLHLERVYANKISDVQLAGSPYGWELAFFSMGELQNVVSDALLSWAKEA